MWTKRSFRDYLHQYGSLPDAFLEEDDAYVEEEEENLPENPLKNAVILTSKQQLELFETCSKVPVMEILRLIPPIETKPLFSCYNLKLIQE